VRLVNEAGKKIQSNQALRNTFSVPAFEVYFFKKQAHERDIESITLHGRPVLGVSWVADGNRQWPRKADPAQAWR
jgi:hypothetical protein